MSWSSKDAIRVLLVVVLLGFAVRLSGLARIGLAEDEANKIQAVRQYQQGIFTGNAEHPMLMKLLILASVSVADTWNSLAKGLPGFCAVDEEVAIRLPNVLAGGLTAIPLYLVGAILFSRRIGLLSSFLWAVGIHAVFINRVAKEDTLMVFFLLWGVYFHLRMKTTPHQETRRKRLLYLLSAASFGLLLASKYFPHFWGVTLLFCYLHRKLDPGWYPTDNYGRRDLALYVAVLGTVFLLANPMVLHPKVLAHILSYTGQATVTHHGYVMFGHLFPNSITLTPLGGTPWYFYLLALLVKLPTLVMLAFAAGVAISLRQWRQLGPFFILFWLGFWLVPYSLVGVKFLRYTLSLMPVVYLAAAFGTFATVDWISARRPGSLQRPGFHLPASGWKSQALLPGLLVVLSLATLISVHPFYSLFVNAVGGGAGHSAYYFPHDECYDLHLREAIMATIRQAPPGCVFAGETPAVFRYYLGRSNRRDVRVVNLSDTRYSLPAAAAVFVFLQPGRIYYENIEFYSRLWNRPADLYHVRIGGRPVVRVFRLRGLEYREIVAARQALPANFKDPRPLLFLTTGPAPVLKRSAWIECPWLALPESAGAQNR